MLELVDDETKALVSQTVIPTFRQLSRFRTRGPKAAGLTRPAASIGYIADDTALVHHHVIHCLYTRVVRKIDMHMGARPDCGLD